MLHDHLDGGVRPATVIELAEAQGVELPVEGEAALADWFTLRPGMPFPEAWARFHLVIRLLQDADSLRRVAREAVEDVAADGVVYLETRFGPLSHRRSGLSADEVMAAVLEGLAEGEAATGHRRPADRLRHPGGRAGPRPGSRPPGRGVGDRGVVGYDIAGAEVGSPGGGLRRGLRRGRPKPGSAGPCTPARWTASTAWPRP